MLKVLISNDDGIYAKGIQVLAESIGKIAEVSIVAPDRNRSGASNSLTLRRPLRLKQISKNQISVEGTPTDCVHVAITGQLIGHIDMVLSGINEGANLGDDVWYSGTVAAAMEGRFLGLPAIAFSLAGHQQEHYDTAAIIAQKIVYHIIQDPLPKSTILNVNIPDIPYSKINGIAVTRLGTRHCAEPTIKQTDPRGNTIYWVGPAGQEADAGEGTDFHAIRQNKVSITPIRVDLTQYEIFDQLTTWVKGLTKHHEN